MTFGMKTMVRASIVINAIFWAIGWWFPFPRFFSVPTMRRLSYVFADLSVLFPVLLLALAIPLSWSYRRSLMSVKYDVVLALAGVAADVFLITRV